MLDIIIIQILFILAIAYINASDSAFQSISQRKLDEEEILFQHLENKQKIIQLFQVLNNCLCAFALLYAMVYFSPQLNKVIPNLVCAHIVVVILTILIITIFGQIIPKKLVLKDALKFSKTTIKINNVLSIIFTPLSFIVNIISKLFLLPFDLDPSEEEDADEDNIRDIVEASTESGLIEENEQEMIENIFEFNDSTVDEIMTRVSDVCMIDSRLEAKEVIEIIMEKGKSRYPVYKDDPNNIIGILHARELLLNVHFGRTNYQDYLRDAYFVPESLKADQLFQDMKYKKIQLAIVIDEYGEISGIVTVEDLLEEIVGNIYDEYDELEVPDIEKLDDKTWKIQGTAFIEDIEEELDIKLKDTDDYETLGGMVFAELHSIPEDGKVFEIEVNELKITVTKVENKRIVEAIVEKLESSID